MAKVSPSVAATWFSTCAIDTIFMLIDMVSRVRFFFETLRMILIPEHLKIPEPLPQFYQSRILLLDLVGRNLIG